MVRVRRHALAEQIEVVAAVDQKIQRVRTRSLDVSFNELLDMYASNELVIDPEYQRLFRWSEGQQSRFIESLILELPLPPIFVIEIEENVYELIDGLQRISSYLHFRGELTDPDTKKTLTPLRLTECDVVRELNGYTYEKLPRPIEIKLKRNFIRMEIIRKESDKRLRYYMFKRLNRGGDTLSDQEVRNCTIRMLDNTFNQFIIDMSRNADFKQCIAGISDEKRKQKYDQELVLRFFAFKNYRKRYVHNIGDFLDEFMETVSDPDSDDIEFKYPEERECFEKTFKILQAALGERTFSDINAQGNYISGFRSLHYEAIALGIQPFIKRIDVTKPAQIERIEKALTETKASREFRDLTVGGGKNYPIPLQERIDSVSRAIRGAL